MYFIAILFHEAGDINTPPVIPFVPAASRGGHLVPVYMAVLVSR